MRTIPNVLSIAGSDPSGGAGIQADLKTFAAFGCHGMAAITALTAQNTHGVSAMHLPPVPFVVEQIDMVFADVQVAAVKVGMLGSAEIVLAVADALRRHRPGALVVDPVLVTTSGATLGDETVVAAMRDALFPLATLVTPNLPEAARLAARAMPRTDAETEALAAALRAGGPAAWLVKGGHRDGATAADVLQDDQGAMWLRSPRLATRNTHGTGCTLSSAIAALLARDEPLRTSVAQAKAYLDRALGSADRLDVGGGPGPVDHFAAWRN